MVDKAHADAKATIDKAAADAKAKDDLAEETRIANKAAADKAIADAQTKTKTTPDNTDAAGTTHTDDDKSSSADSTNTVAIVVGVSMGAIVVIISIALIVLLKRRRQDDVPAAVAVVPVDTSGKHEEQLSVKAALEQYREASTRADFVSAIRLLTQVIREGRGSEVSQVGKRDLTSIAGEFHKKVGDEVWKELRHLFLTLLKEYNERMGCAPPVNNSFRLADNPLALANPMHQQDDNV